MRSSGPKSTQSTNSEHADYQGSRGRKSDVPVLAIYRDLRIGILTAPTALALAKKGLAQFVHAPVLLVDDE